MYFNGNSNITLPKNYCLNTRFSPLSPLLFTRITRIWCVLKNFTIQPQSRTPPINSNPVHCHVYHYNCYLVPRYNSGHLYDSFSTCTEPLTQSLQLLLLLKLAILFAISSQARLSLTFLLESPLSYPIHHPSTPFYPSAPFSSSSDVTIFAVIVMIVASRANNERASAPQPCRDCSMFLHDYDKSHNNAVNASHCCGLHFDGHTQTHANAMPLIIYIGRVWLYLNYVRNLCHPFGEIVYTRWFRVTCSISHRTRKVYKMTENRYYNGECNKSTRRSLNRRSQKVMSYSGI